MAAPTRPTQSLWEELNVPGVDPRLDQIITLLGQIADKLGTAAASPPTASGSAPVSTPASSGGLVSILPRGTVFTLPVTLQVFNELVGATQTTGALPTETVLEASVGPYSVGTLAYQVPAEKYAVAMAPFYGYFSHHSPGITLTGFLNYGLPGALPVTQPNLPVVRDFAISREVTESHELTSNLTILVANNTPVRLDITFVTTWLLIDIALWNSTYAPIFRQALRAWVEAMAVDARRIGGQTT